MKLDYLRLLDGVLGAWEPACNAADIVLEAVVPGTPKAVIKGLYHGITKFGMPLFRLEQYRQEFSIGQNDFSSAQESIFSMEMGCTLFFIFTFVSKLNALISPEEKLIAEESHRNVGELFYSLSYLLLLIKICLEEHLRRNNKLGPANNDNSPAEATLAHEAIKKQM